MNRRRNHFSCNCCSICESRHIYFLSSSKQASLRIVERYLKAESGVSMSQKTQGQVELQTRNFWFPFVSLASQVFCGQQRFLINSCFTILMFEVVRQGRGSEDKGFPSRDCSRIEFPEALNRRLRAKRALNLIVTDKTVR